MLKVRWLLIASALMAAGCDDQPFTTPSLLAEGMIYGIVRDEAGIIPAIFTVTLEGRNDPNCQGPPFMSTTGQFGGSGLYRMVVSTRFPAACYMIIVAVPDNNVIADTTDNVQLHFSMPTATDSLRHDVVLRRRDEWQVRRRAMLGISGIPSSIQVIVPDSATRNQPFTMSSSHHGSTSCTTLDTNEVSYSGQTAVLSPYVLEKVVGGCTLDLRTFTQTAQVTFINPGPATIQVIGRDTIVTRTTFVR